MITSKGLIAIEYLTKYPKHTTSGIARLMHNDYPSEFTSFENARDIVRTHRDEKKGKKTKTDNTNFKRTPMEKKQALNRYLKSDYKELKPFILPKKNNNILFLSDIHLPYHDMNAVDLAIKYGKENKVNTVYLNGDILDFYQLSRFTKDRRLRDFASEIEMGRDFLDYLKKELKADIFYKIGNHEDRYENYIKQNAPELLGVGDFDFASILRLKEKNIQLIDGKQMAYAGKLAMLHGHEFGHSVFSPVNPARGLYMRSKESSIIGHHHQSSEHSEKSLSGVVVTAWSVGCLCGLKPDYYPFNKWNHGFAHITTDNNGNYKVKNIRIIENAIV
jgi:predicted phosphodiesterase